MAVNFDTTQLQRQINTIQKEIGMKMKVRRSAPSLRVDVELMGMDRLQKKENADELKAAKAALDLEVVTSVATAKAAEIIMRRKAGTIGNFVHESVPVSESEVSRSARGRGRGADGTFLARKGRQQGREAVPP